MIVFIQNGDIGSGNGEGFILRRIVTIMKSYLSGIIKPKMKLGNL